MPSAARRIRLLGTGTALPSASVTSLELDSVLGLPPGSVERRTGVRRRFVENRRTAASLGAEAAEAALTDAGLTIADVDCLLSAGGTPDQAMPGNAALIHGELGPAGHAIPAFDVGASCLSFAVALDTAACLIDAGRYRRILIAASDIASCGVDWETLEAAGIFGDGAAAVVVGPAEGSTSALLASAFATYSEGARYCEIKGGGSRHHPSRISEPFLPLARFRMDGPAVFRLAAEKLPALVSSVLEAAGTRMDEMAVVVPHQASAHVLRWLRRRFRIRPEQLVDIFTEHGNQVAASLPSALHAAIRDGRLRRGEKVLLLGSGAGVSFGGMVLCY